MAITTTDSIKAEADAFKSAYAEEPEKPKKCDGCKTAAYCADHGCQMKAAAKLKQLEG